MIERVSIMFEIDSNAKEDHRSMYGKYLTLLGLVYDMQSSNDGISYADIQSQYGVSRRTAERMMKAIIESNSDVEVVHHRPTKRWRIRQSIEAPSPTLNHLAMLDTAAKMFKRSGMREESDYARELSRFFKVRMKHSRLTRLDADLEILQEAEIFSHRPGPAQIIESGVLKALRDAIKGFNKVSFDYVAASGKIKRWSRTHPYGFLHGNNTRSYLLAFIDDPKINEMRSFTLTNISKLKVYPDQFFERQSERSIEHYLENCFGVFKEDQTYQVVWRFDVECTDVAKTWVFHPSQTVNTLDDGRIEVSFEACGLFEMAWHIVTWGELVEVVEPPELIDALRTVKNSIRLPR